MKKVLILIFLAVSLQSFSQRISRLSANDPIATVYNKVNKVIDDNIVKAGAIVFVTDYGLIADGSTDDGPAIQACFDAAAAGSIIQFPAGKSIKISTTVYTEKQLTIIGNYCNIICDSNVAAFYLNVQDECVFKDFTFTGSGKNVTAKSDQIGLMFNGGVRHQISNLRFNLMSGVGLLGVNNYGESSTLQQQGSNINNITLWFNTIGIALMSRSEYNVMTNITAYENATAIQDYSGNNVLDGFSMEANSAYGYRMAAGNNVGHGSIANGSFNHHTTAYGIHCNANGTGVLINNVNFYQTNNRFENGTKAVVFSNCAFDGTASAGAVTFDGSTTVHNLIQNCWFTVAATDPKTKFSATNSAKFSVINMRRVDGTIFNFGNYTSTLLAAKTTNYTVTSGDAAWTTKFDCTSGALTASVLSAADMEGQRLYFMKVDASGNAMIIDPNGSETINGSSTSLSITTQWQMVVLEGYQGNWIRLQ